MRPEKKHLSFQALRQVLADHFSGIPDNRIKEQSQHSLHDVLMSGFAMMYFQDPSLLQFQTRMQEELHRNNLNTLFQVQSLPKSTQMRDLTDEVDREHFRPIFKEFTHQLQRGKQLQKYKLFGNKYLVAWDGSQYFGSNALQCSGCLKKEHRDGSVSYAHHILQAAIMHPEQKQVLPLMPEEIRNEDGSNKQDCEMNAAKRLAGKIRKDHPQLEMIIVGDGLYSKQPLIDTLEKHRMSYILVAKPDDHKIMMEWYQEQQALGEVRVKEYTDNKGKTHRYEWIHSIPLNGNEETKEVNFFRYFQIREQDGKITYQNSWVTDLDITEQNIVELVKAGRCRWKIENECFNTLKNQGYHIEHNYGHGTKNLSFNFLLLTLLAFFFHQIFELSDELYQACRKKCGSKRYLWEKLRGLIGFLIVDTWELLLRLIWEPESYRINKDPAPP